MEAPSHSVVPLQVQANPSQESPQISQQQPAPQPLDPLNTIPNNSNVALIATGTNNEIETSQNEKQTETQILESSIQQIINNTTIPAEAQQFTFGCQIMIIGLNSRSELNKKLGFVVGDFKPYSKRIPVRLITHSDPSNAPTFLLKLCNLQFVSPPIPGYDVEAYQSDSNLSDDDSDLSHSHSNTDSDSDSTSSDESSLPPSIANFHSISITNTHQNAQMDEIGTNDPNEDDDIKLSADKLKIINQNASKYYDIMQKFNRRDSIDLSPSITSTKSLPINCGLRWEPKAITEAIGNMSIEKIGTIKNIINDLEIIIESVHSPQTVITFDSVLCLKDHTPIGRVDDVIGRVKKPHYFVRLTVDKAVLLKDKLTLNQDVYAVKPLTNYAVPPQTDERYSSESECELSSDDDDDAQYRPNSIKPKRQRRAMSVERPTNANATAMNANNRNRNWQKRNNQPHKRKYYNNNYYNNNKRQRYSNPMSWPWQNLQHVQQPQPVQQQQPYIPQAAAMAYQPYMYSAFNPLPAAIPPPPPQGHALSAATAAFFRPQVNIIPSPPTNYRYNLATNSPQHRSPSGSVSSLRQIPPQQQRPQQVTPPQQQRPSPQQQQRPQQQTPPQQQRPPQQPQTQQVQKASLPNATISINPFSFQKPN